MSIHDQKSPMAMRIQVDDGYIEGDMSLPCDPSALIIFAHGSGSSRYSTRNREVARYLNGRGLGTLLMDLLTPEEEQIDQATAQYRFDIPRLARRVIQATGWVDTVPETASLPIGYFGASTGAAAALIAAAESERVKAVVSRGGRTDLAGNALSKVKAPTLMLAGGNDDTIIALNRESTAQMQCKTELSIIPGATHLFEETGALEAVSRKAGDWFLEHCAVVSQHP